MIAPRERVFVPFAPTVAAGIGLLLGMPILVSPQVVDARCGVAAALPEAGVVGWGGRSVAGSDRTGKVIRWC